MPSKIEKPSKSGEIRLRVTTPEEDENTCFNQEMMRQRKLPGNARKPDDEIAKLAHAALYGIAA